MLCGWCNIEMELETINLCGTSDVQTASTTDEEDVDEEITTTTTSSGGGGASDCCMVASDSSCPEGKTYMGKFIIVYSSEYLYISNDHLPPLFSDIR